MAGSLHSSPRDLWFQLCIPNLDETDLQNVWNNASEISIEDRGRTEQVVKTCYFCDWVRNPGSAKLLVHGDFSTTNKISPLLVLAAAVMRALRATSGVISLVFFCEYHLARDEYRGGGVMIRSLIVQLLRQVPFVTIEPHPEIQMHGLGNESIERLCRLFVHLVRQLFPETTVYCLIDGINEYESEDYIHEMDSVILTLLELVNESQQMTSARFKLLLTSPQPTLEVRKVFEDEPGALLHMAQMPAVEERVGFARIQEQLGAGFEGNR